MILNPAFRAFSTKSRTQGVLLAWPPGSSQRESHESANDAWVFFTSAYPGALDLPRGARYAFVTKPFTRESLARALDEEAP